LGQIKPRSHLFSSVPGYLFGLVRTLSLDSTKGSKTPAGQFDGYGLTRQAGLRWNTPEWVFRFVESNGPKIDYPASLYSPLRGWPECVGICRGSLKSCRTRIIPYRWFCIELEEIMLLVYYAKNKARRSICKRRKEKSLKARGELAS